MRIPSILSFLALNICFGSISIAQQGIPYIHYYDSREGFESQNWSVCQDDHNAMLFANKSGISSFDGQTWRSVALSRIPLKIKYHPATGDVYVLSDHNNGWLHRDEKGNYIFKPLDEGDEPVGSQGDILFTPKHVIFYREDRLSIISAREKRLVYQFNAAQYGLFSGVIVQGGTVYVNIRGKGLHRLENESLFAVPGAGSIAQQRILFTLPVSDSEVILGLDNGSMKLFNGAILKDYRVADQDYLREYKLSDGIMLNDSCYALSSLYGGVLIVKKSDGSTITSLNYINGLPDDEIYAIGSDNNGGLWITYKYGICRVDLSLPIRDYSYFPGLEGMLTNAAWYDDCLYVTTTEGLFYLAEEKHYSKEEIVLRRKVPAAMVEHDTHLVEEEEIIRGTQEKRGFFSRLRHRGEVVQEDTPEKPQEPLQVQKEEPAQREEVVRKTITRLESVEYVYKKVRGLNTRSEWLLGTETALLVGSTSGLYGVLDSIAVRLSSSRNIRDIHRFDERNYYVISDEGLEIMELLEDGWIKRKPDFKLEEPLFSVTNDPEYIWVSGYSKVYRISSEQGDQSGTRVYPFYSIFPEELSVSYLNDTLFVFSNTGIDYYEVTGDTFKIYRDSRLHPDQYSSLEVFPSAPGIQWLKADNRMMAIPDGESAITTIENYTGLFKNVTSLSSDSKTGYWIVDNNNRLFNIKPSGEESFSQEFRVYIDRITNTSGEAFTLHNPVFTPDERVIEIHLSAPFFPGGNLTDFQYFIEGRMEDWSRFSPNPEILLFLESGYYRVRVRARNGFGEISGVEAVNITIRSPFYRQSWFFMSVTPLLLLLFYVIFYLRERKIRRDKAVLEEKVKERTAQIAEQKKQIEIQKNEITESINYASQIQKAVLPSDQLYSKNFGEHFILYKPKDIVSGDFYWIIERDDRVIFAVADCTGHGVPGAIMSILGNSTLNEITRNVSNHLTAYQILNRLRTMINQALSQSGITAATFDGMDIALCIFDRAGMELEYAGANNPLFLVRNGTMMVHKADRMPIGYFPEEKSFTSQTIKIEKGDIIYLFSDGYVDQFGGPLGKKFSTKRFEELLHSISGKALKEQKQILDATVEEWRGDNSQIDDILVMGLKF